MGRNEKNRADMGRSSLWSSLLHGTAVRIFVFLSFLSICLIIRFKISKYKIKLVLVQWFSLVRPFYKLRSLFSLSSVGKYLQISQLVEMKLKLKGENISKLSIREYGARCSQGLEDFPCISLVRGIF